MTFPFVCLLSAALQHQGCSSLRTRVRVYDRTSSATMPHDAGVRTPAADRRHGASHASSPLAAWRILEQHEHVGASLTKPPRPRRGLMGLERQWYRWRRIRGASDNGEEASSACRDCLS